MILFLLPQFLADNGIAESDVWSVGLYAGKVDSLSVRPDHAIFGSAQWTYSEKTEREHASINIDGINIGTCRIPAPPADSLPPVVAGGGAL